MIYLSQVMRITVIGLGLNAFLIALKLGVGITVGSAALVADAIHSLSDLATDVVALLGIRLASRPADEGHAYGHGRFESISAALIGVALVAGGVIIAWRAGLDLSRGEENIPGYPMLVVAAVSIVSKEWLFRATRRIARTWSSPTLQANAWHHRSDALSSMAVLFGGIAGSAGWGHGDQAAALAVGAMLVVVGAGAIWRVFVELTESSVSAEESRLIVQAIGQIPGVRGWHRLRTRVVGREVFMDVHVLVDPWLSVDESHDICSSVERSVGQCLERPTNVIVHCEPYYGSVRGKGDHLHDRD